LTNPAAESSFTEILQECRTGSKDAVGRLFACMYDLLHGLARKQLQGQARAHTWQPTVLVHEAFLRLDGREELDWDDRAHFLRAAGSAMRCALIDHARERSRLKRSAPGAAVSLESIELAYESRAVDLLDLNAALKRMEEAEPRLSELVELRFFAGCSVEEAAKVLGIAKRRAERDWAFARRWLFRELSIS
jgi:RNA polymerase sigma factor (TIGR02999 family)